MNLSTTTALLLIDFQIGLQHHPAYGSERNNPDAEKVAASLLQRWRMLAYPIVHIKHNSDNPESPLRPGSPGNAIRNEVKPLAGEFVLEKHVNCAFIGTSLEQHLRAQGITSLILTGMVTEHCVAATAIAAGNLGFNTRIVEDATATFSKVCIDGRHLTAAEVHSYALSFLHKEFVEVVQSTDVLRELGKNQSA